MNLDGVQHERVRKLIDPVLVAAKEELDICHYGAQRRGVFIQDGASGWKYGHSAPFRGYDCIVATLPAPLVALLGAAGQERLTQVQAARLHNTLSAMMDLAYSIAKTKANRNLPQPYAEDELNPVVDRSKDRVIKDFARQHMQQFLDAVKDNPPATYADAAAIWNAVNVVAGEHATKPAEIKRSAGHALDRLRDMEAATGIKARDLTGTLPEA